MFSRIIKYSQIKDSKRYMKQKDYRKEKMTYEHKGYKSGDMLKEHIRIYKYNISDSEHVTTSQMEKLHMHTYKQTYTFILKKFKEFNSKEKILKI